MTRIIASAVVCGLAAVVARRQRTLSRSGSIAGFITGVICAAAGWSWLLLLVTLFISANILSRFHHAAKQEGMGDIVEKGGERDAWQVAANGGVFAAAALASLIHPSPLWLPIGAGAIAASTADTWATEIGTLVKHPPRLITTRELVPAGTSGGVTWSGTVAGLAGALCIAIVALLAGWGLAAAMAAIIGGFAGSLADSLAGAMIQRRQWCDQCEKPTERLVHGCGTTTRAHGGVGWVNNDVVNAISSVTGALVGAIWLGW